ncbi:MAG: arsenate reductase ArsC [Acidobacteria bacterium]|nr:arsenate reductase ArsC [Acidobacteriota bacterium]MCL5287299.1 arsenate reductase ArsC [Acidobacteriota bacterium]
MTTRILFLCTGNRARSQMAEGLARSLAAPGVEVASAGTHPDVRGIHSLAIEMLREKGIDASAHRSKHVDELKGEFDFVITLCDSAAQECPMYPARRARLHWGLTDPAVAGGDPAQQRAIFREVCNEIERRLRAWMAAEGLMKQM